VTEAFLTDMDGKLALPALRAQYPKLPLIVLTGYGDEARRELVANLAPSAYFAKPLQLEPVLTELDSLPLDATTEDGQPAPAAASAPCAAYAFLRLKDKERAAHILLDFQEMEGVEAANAVRGEYDIILRLAAGSSGALAEVLERIKRAEGVSVAAAEIVEQPHLTLEVDEFLRHYAAVSADDRAAYAARNETNAYLMVDLDRYHLEPIYASILLTEGVVDCQVSNGGSKLTVLMSGAVRPNVLRHVLQKLAAMDGIRRVRDATVINVES
jgi:CheY-like chemotaxis protein